MNFPVQDQYWTETLKFIREAIGTEAPFIAPREFQPELPKVFAYDWVNAVEVLRDYQGVVVHKGLMHELPVAVLKTMRDEWKCVFANPVFLVFMPPGTGFPAVTSEHLGPFYENLEFLEKLDKAKRAQTREASACAVVAMRGGAGLDAMLKSISLLHLATVVVPDRNDAALGASCRELCARYRADYVELETGEALKTGLARLLEEERNAWIASLDDSVVVRPDFIATMERWREAGSRPLLGGWWEEADGLVESFQRDGFDVVVPVRPNGRFLYAHRDYWVRRFGFSTSQANLPEVKALVIPGLVIPQAAD
jgi:hypothetical protein